MKIFLYADRNWRGEEREGDYYFKYWELGIEMFDLLIWRKFDF